MEQPPSAAEFAYAAAQDANDRAKRAQKKAQTNEQILIENNMMLKAIMLGLFGKEKAGQLLFEAKKL